MAWSWPLPLHLSTRFAHDPGDPLLVTYLLWWNAHVVPLTEAMWNAPFYWPLRDALALTEHGAGMGVVASPIQWLGGSPLLAYNVLLIVSAWWSAWAAHALVRRLTGSMAAAFCAGIAFGFAPYRASQLAHLHLLVTWWLPLALLALHAYYEDGRRRWLALFGASWLLQGLTNGYYMFFLPVLLLLWVLAFTDWRTQWRRAAAVTATFILFSLPLIPVLLKYYTVQRALGLGRARSEMQMFSAHWSSFLNAGPLLRFWPSREPITQEDFLFPGVTGVIAVLACLLLARRQLGVTRRAFIFYGTAAIAMTWFAFGPSSADTPAAALWHAYSWIAWLPGFSGLRVPERFFMLATLCLAVAVGLAVAAIVRAFPRRAAIVTGVVAAGLIADGWIVAMPLGAPPRSFGVPLERNARVLELPLTDDNVNVGAIYRGMLHGLPVVNGYAGYVPPHTGVIDWALRRRDPSVLTELRRGRPLYVAIANGAEAPAWTAFMDAQSDAKMLGVTGAGRLYLLPVAGYRPTITMGAPLSPIASRTEDVWVVQDLGAPVTVRVVEIRTRGHYVLLGQAVAVQTSMDGQTWTTVAYEPPGGLALAGVMAEPRALPIRVIVPDVTTRFIRATAAAFGVQSMTVFGPELSASGRR